MSSLLIKHYLFISLLSSVAMPFSVQAVIMEEINSDGTTRILKKEAGIEDVDIVTYARMIRQAREIIKGAWIRLQETRLKEWEKAALEELEAKKVEWARERAAEAAEWAKKKAESAARAAVEAAEWAARHARHAREMEAIRIEAAEWAARHAAEAVRDVARTAEWARRNAVFEIQNKVATEVEGARLAVMKARTAAAQARSVAAKMVTARADLALGVGMGIAGVAVIGAGIVAIVRERKAAKKRLKELRKKMGLALN